jgi:hypothetical protein
MQFEIWIRAASSRSKQPLKVAKMQLLEQNWKNHSPVEMIQYVV